MATVVVATAYGGPEVLSARDESAGQPGKGEALIAVRAAGINPADYKTYSGAFGTDPSKLPLRIGSEAAGVVTQVGPDDGEPGHSFQPGDDVIAYRAPGAYATELILPVSALVLKPASLDWAPASALMVTGVTAWHCLEATGVSPGDNVLVHGGAGGVGTMAVQLAILRGAHVIATASQGKHEFLSSLGALPVSYGAGLADRVLEAAPGGIDAAIDLVGTDDAVDVSLEVVADRARIATIAAFGRAQQAGIKALGGGPGADPGTQIRNSARPELARLAGDGTLRVFVTKTYSLAEVAEAHRAIREGHTMGKLVLIP